MNTWNASFSILQNPAVMGYLLKGVAFTLVISVVAVLLGLVLGSVLALARNYCNRGPARILKWLATAYIELFRNTPLLLWIFICLVFPSPARLYVPQNAGTLFGGGQADVQGRCGPDPVHLLGHRRRSSAAA